MQALDRSGHVHTRASLRYVLVYYFIREYNSSSCSIPQGVVDIVPSKDGAWALKASKTAALQVKR